MSEQCACGEHIRILEHHECPQPKEVHELTRMMAAVAADWRSWFGMGEMRCRRVLSNGAVVRVSIRMPAQPKPEGGDRG